MSALRVVIVTWNSAGTIEACLDSCAGLDVTVVDNASSDSTVECIRSYDDVYLIANSDNRGFATAVNQAVARTDAEYILLLNPDVELIGDVKPLVDSCASEGVVMSAGRLVDASGSTQRGFTIRRLPRPLTLIFEVLGLNRLFPGNALNRRYRYLDLPLEMAADVEQPAGAFLMFPRQLWRDLDGFDERFHPVWFEDVDFCKRALERGRIRYIPEVTARHKGGASIEQLNWSCREVCWYASLLRYAAKHFSPFEFRGVCGAVVLGSAIRLLMRVFQRRGLIAIKVYAKTAGLALRCVVSGRMRERDAVDEYQQGSTVRTIPAVPNENIRPSN